jgi:hypothetical protein
VLKVFYGAAGLTSLAENAPKEHMSAEIVRFGKNLAFELLLRPRKPVFLNRLFNLGVVERGSRREGGNTQQEPSGQVISTPPRTWGVSTEHHTGFRRVCLKLWRRWLHGTIPMMSPTVSWTVRGIGIFEAVTAVIL